MAETTSEETTWRTRDGQEIPVHDLTDDHLRNILAGLRDGTLFPMRRLRREKNSGYVIEDGSHRNSTLNITLFNGVQADARQRWLHILGAEAERRGLPIPEADDGVDYGGHGPAVG